MALFKSFINKPDDVRFKEQEADEQIEILLRRHWITNVPWIFFGIILFIAPVFLTRFVFFLDNTLALTLSPQLFASLVIFWYLATIGYIFTNFLIWYFNIYLLTNTHIIEVNLRSILNSSVTSSQYGDVEAVNYEFLGFLGSLFRYGKVTIETAAKDETIVFTKVPNPDQVADRIEDMEGKNDKP